LFNNNDLNSGIPPFSFEYDGFTNVFTASFTGLSAGVHSIKLAIADSGDLLLDSGVFIKAGSFSDASNPVPEQGTVFLLGGGLLGMLGIKRKKTEEVS